MSEYEKIEWFIFEYKKSDNVYLNVKNRIRFISM